MQYWTETDDREINCEWKVEIWRNLKMEIFRMHLHQQHGCINCATEGKLEINC